MKTYQFYKKLKNDQFSLIYLGEFDDELTSLLMEIQEAASKEGRGIKKRVSYLIAECFQNIIRHSDLEFDEEQELRDKMFMMRSVDGTHYLSSTNPIEKANIPTLVDTLESIKKLSLEELKSIYLNALGNNKLSDKGGGGLGLIEMARKTKNPPVYHFEPINDTYSNFFLHLKMNQVENPGFEIKIQETVDLYKDMLDSNIVLLRKGDFSQESILPLFRLFESNLQLKKEDLVFKKKSLYILIELLQNMNRHAAEIAGAREGMFLITLKDGAYTMETGNYIQKDKAKIFETHLNSLVGLDNIELAKRYKKQLMKEVTDEDQGAGIGVIEMFRQSGGEINFNFIEENDEVCFFSLEASL
ncbi:MAG: SiaB family protein kinase [Crocinitomicaceae bacterium]